MDNLALRPIVVDLDREVIATGVSQERILRIIRNSPAEMLRIPLWLVRDGTDISRHLAARVTLDVTNLPYRGRLLEWIGTQRAQGRRIVLATSRDRNFAEAISAHLGLFDEIMILEGGVSNSTASGVLQQRFAGSGFERPSVDVRSRDTSPVPWIQTLRAHQWLKNLLLFVPLFAAHDIANAGAWKVLLLAFLAFNLCASSVYIANDLLDLDSDRLHPRKRNRPFASGAVPLGVGLVLSPVLLLASLLLALQVGKALFASLAAYFLVTSLYSWILKRIVLVDCLTLALLYTLRVIAGAAAVEHELSFWLLAFSVFLFLSLAFVKRYAELEAQRLSGRGNVHGRGYHTDDAQLIQIMGIAAGQVAVLVLALYLNSEAVVQLYRHPEVIWGTVPIMLFWINWMWIQAHRGQMHDDPLVFAVKDGASLLAGALFAGVLAAGSARIPW